MYPWCLATFPKNVYDVCTLRKKIYFYLFLILYLCGKIHPHMSADTLSVQEGVLHPMQLELQEAVRYHRVLETEPRSSAGALSKRALFLYIKKYISIYYFYLCICVSMHRCTCMQY